jgi:hypothetical protein
MSYQWKGSTIPETAKEKRELTVRNLIFETRTALEKYVEAMQAIHEPQRTKGINDADQTAREVLLKWKQWRQL